MFDYFSALVGQFFVDKARAQQREKGTFQAARNLRKQGVPIELARRILLGARVDQPSETVEV